MPTLELTTEEVQALVELLDARLGEMSEEIHHATVSSFKEQLRERRDLLRALRRKLADAA